MKVLVTGSAGFVGYHTSRRLLSDGHDVLGVDCLTPYYDVALKHGRLDDLRSFEKFQESDANLADAEAITSLVSTYQPEVVIHLAAQAGVRYSLEAPGSYVESNLIGTYNLLEALRHNQPKHLLFSSTSSIYGGNTSLPFSEQDRSDYPISWYAATKRSCEGMIHSYSHLYDIPSTCFRFFTVYGPWGRPDMALFKFVKNVKAGLPIDVYGTGENTRDYTFVEDLVECIVRLSDQVPSIATAVSDQDTISPVAPWRVVNIAGGKPITLNRFIDVLEERLGTPIQRNVLPMQPGDVVSTSADFRLLESLIGYRPGTSLEEGVDRFVTWYDERESLVGAPRG